jgi:hypothetical protein
MSSDDFYSASEKQGRRILNVDGLGENREAQIKVFSHLNPDHRRTVLSGIDRELGGTHESSNLRHVAKLNRLRADLEKRHRGLLRLGR